MNRRSFLIGTLLAPFLKALPAGVAQKSLPPLYSCAASSVNFYRDKMRACLTMDIATGPDEAVVTVVKDGEVIHSAILRPGMNRIDIPFDDAIGFQGAKINIESASKFTIFGYKMTTTTAQSGDDSTVSIGVSS